jgi:imidazolonepropionase-like amidohydrolase
MVGETLSDYDILIDNGKILKIERNISLTNQKVEVIDATGFNIYHGFIDAHCHIGISEEKVGSVGNDCNESTNPITPNVRAIDAINPMDSAFHSALAVGITTVMTGPGSANVIGGQLHYPFLPLQQVQHK